MKQFLPYGRHSVDDDDLKAVEQVLKSFFWTTGPVVEEFEKKLCDMFGAKYAVCANSGTAALHLIVAGLGIGPGDWVIVPSITFVATANAVRFCGGEVIFSDVDPDNGLLTPKLLEETISQHKDKNLKAVMPVHLTGQMEDIAAIYEIASKHNLFVIEDSCHALGTTYNDNKGEQYFVGGCKHSEAAMFSFHPVKTIATGEGGALVTNDENIYKKAVLLRTHGVEASRETFTVKEQAFNKNGIKNPWYYEMLELGFNYRLTDISCALGLSQLNRLDNFVTRRRYLASIYDAELKEQSQHFRPIKRTKNCNPAWHLYSVLIDLEKRHFDKAEFMLKLTEKQIGTQVHYIPVYSQPYYEKRYGKQRLPGAESYYKRTLSIPLYPGMEDEDVYYVVETMAELLNKISKR